MYAIHNYIHVKSILPEKFPEPPLRVIDVDASRKLAVQMLRDKRTSKQSSMHMVTEDPVAVGEHEPQLPAGVFERTPKSRNNKCPGKATTVRQRLAGASAQAGAPPPTSPFQCTPAPTAHTPAVRECFPLPSTQAGVSSSMSPFQSTPVPTAYTQTPAVRPPRSMGHPSQPDYSQRGTIPHWSHRPLPIPSLPHAPADSLPTPAEVPPHTHTRTMPVPQSWPSPNWHQPYHAPGHSPTTPFMVTGSRSGLLAYPVQSPPPGLSISPAGFQLSTLHPTHPQSPPITHYPVVTTGFAPSVPQQSWQSASVNEYGLAPHGPRYANNSTQQGPLHTYAATAQFTTPQISQTAPIYPPVPPTSYVHPGYIPEVDFPSDNAGPSSLSTWTDITATSMQPGYGMGSSCMRW